MNADEELLRRLARHSGLRQLEVRRFLELEVVSVSDASGEIDRDLLRRLRRARRLRRDLGLSLDAVVIIQRLLDRLEALEGRPASRLGIRVLDEHASPEADDW